MCIKGQGKVAFAHPDTIAHIAGHVRHQSQDEATLCLATGRVADLLADSTLPATVTRTGMALSRASCQSAMQMRDSSMSVTP